MADDRYPNYPPGCPPNPRHDGRGTFYRAVKLKDQPRDRDFYSPARMREGEDMEPCEREAISIFSSLSDAASALKLMRGHPRRYVAELHLKGDQGVIRASPGELQSHHEWWIPADVDPKRYVVVTHGPF